MRGRRTVLLDLVVPIAAAMVLLALAAVLVWVGMGHVAIITECPEPMVRVELSDGVVYCAEPRI